MGIWDRDWYAEHLRKRDGYRERADFRRSKAPDGRDAPHQRTPRNTETGQLRDLPGVNWHWTIKLIAYGLTLLVILIVIRHFKG